jgi:predicted phosphodiesterase
VRLGIVADIHGNEVALRAVLADASDLGIDRWWALGDLVLFGPRPAEVVAILGGLPGLAALSGNTDRYVLTDEQPPPHATAADASADAGLVERFGAMAGQIGWTRGALVQAGLLGTLTALPDQLRTTLPDGTKVLGVHASPVADEGAGIDPQIPDAELAALLSGCAADVVIGGHTHAPTDRVVDGIRALNPGSTGLPRAPGMAGWLLLSAEPGDGVTAELRSVPFDADAVIREVHERHLPSAGFIGSLLDGTHWQSSAGMP